MTRVFWTVPRYFVEHKGIAESDIKDWGWYYHRDAVWIKLYNGRKLEASGIELYRAESLKTFDDMWRKIYGSTRNSRNSKKS